MAFLNKRAKFAGLASMALAATSAAVLFASQAAFATTTPGDNGTVKVHDSTTAVTDPQDNPHVCQFYLDGFNFDGAQSVTWYIDSWPPTGNKTEVLNGSLTMDANGDGHTADQSLPNGHYKLFWNFTPANGGAKQKVFWVNCPAPTPTSTTPTSTTPATTTSASPSPTCTCASTSPTTPPAPGTQTQTSPAKVQAAPAPVAVTGSLPVTG